MQSLGKTIEADYRLTFDGENYSRVSEFNTENNKQKISWYYEGEISWEKVNKELGEKLEKKYNDSSNDIILKKTLIDVEERIVYGDVLYLRTFTNWPRGEETCWLTRSHSMEKDLTEQLKNDNVQPKDIPRMSFWGNDFEDPELPITLEREYQNKYGSV